MRFFANNMPDFVPGMSVQIDKSRWKGIILKILDSILRHMPPTPEHCDGGLYVGAAGLAYAYYYLARSDPFNSHRDDLLQTAKKYMDASLEASMSKHSRDPSTSFLLGGAGVFSVGSLINSMLGKQDVGSNLLKKYQQIGATLQPTNFDKHGSDELFVGRAGYICGALLLNRHYQQQVS